MPISVSLDRLSWDKLLFIIGFLAIIVSIYDKILLTLGGFFIATGFFVALYHWDLGIRRRLTDEDDIDFRLAFMSVIFIIYLAFVGLIFAGYLFKWY